VVYLKQVHIQRLGPGMVQQFQSRCSDCNGQGEKFRGMHSVDCVPCLPARLPACLPARLHDSWDAFNGEY